MAKVKYVSQENGWTTLQAFRDPTSDGWETILGGERLFVDREDIAGYIEFFTKLQKASKKEEN